MNKFTLAFLFGTGILLGLSKYLGSDEMTPIYIVALMLVVLPMMLIFDSDKRKNLDEERAMAILQEAQNINMAKKEVKSKIPKNSPRRESSAAFEGAAKVGAARSMATMVRKPRLREKILEICDFADMVLETIRRMPYDTPAAIAFSENHLSKLTEALDRCFEMSKRDDYKHAPESLDAKEIECFSIFISAFKKQQENILTEGKRC
ncbi:MAG: hypothetical protein LBQ58_07820 [Synergistaceae bacterium]|nr:hypothetical protein [Synergistaceae bacterium]